MNVMIKSNLKCHVPNILRNALFIVFTIHLFGIKESKTDDSSPAFFLKIAKNIPRVGRDSGIEDFFLKASNSIPRVDKREQLEHDYTLFPYEKNGEYFKPIKRRIGYPPVTGTNHSLLKHFNHFHGSDTWTWEHFPLAIEGPPELWRTLAGYSNEKVFESSDNIDNEIHHQDKREEKEN